MSIPETTSAEGFERFVGGKILFESRGEAWRDVKAWIVALPSVMDAFSLPSVSDPFLAWTISGEVDFQERENGRPWLTNRIKKGSFFLTSGGAPYDVCWKSVTSEPFEAMSVFIELPMLQRALEEVFGTDASEVRLRDLSGFTDDVLDAMMQQIRRELMREHASPLLVQGIGQAIAIHLARNYAVTSEELRSGSPSLPGYKLRQITEWMGEHVADELNLDRLAAQVGLSKFHFHRPFKRAIGESPAHYQLNLRMSEARRLLRETNRSVVNVALDVGYTNPSHFAKLFKRQNGLAPSEYRRRR